MYDTKYKIISAQWMEDNDCFCAKIYTIEHLIKEGPVQGRNQKYILEGPNFPVIGIKFSDQRKIARSEIFCKK